MSCPNFIIGIDTSNYTTSLGIVTLEGEVVANLKIPLAVKSGECGLRQSDAVFAHVKNLPNIIKDAEKYVSCGKIAAVGVSSRPRKQQGSYMPCFLSGIVAAQSIASISGGKLYEYSHQCGHIMAALYSSGKMDLADSQFAAFHVSGGTTEILRVFPDTEGFLVELVGGTEDINAGQAIDRIGVMLGLDFPAGAHLEQLALANTVKIPKKKISVNGLRANLSGLENLACKLYRDTENREIVSAFALDFVGRTLYDLRKSYVEAYGDVPFVFAGGVMSNSIIKGMLADNNTYFAEPKFSSDNAVGIALLALRSYNNERNS